MVNLIAAWFLVGLVRLLGGFVTSWYRTAERNAEVGGVANSKHLIGQAVDVRLGTIEGFEWLFRSLGFKWLKEDDHIHIEYTSNVLLGSVGLALVVAIFLAWKNNREVAR